MGGAVIIFVVVQVVHQFGIGVCIAVLFWNSRVFMLRWQATTRATTAFTHNKFAVLFPEPVHKAIMISQEAHPRGDGKLASGSQSTAGQAKQLHTLATDIRVAFSNCN